ncbi:MAG: methyltransferase, FxLD system [Sciscionella sp.]
MRAERLRARLVQRMWVSGAVHHAEIAAAFRTVPREVFLPGMDLVTAYTDDALVTARDEDGRPISSSSQPSMMAIMLEQLSLRPGHRVLEIGAGTGYNAAVLAELVGSEGLVVSMDLDEEIVRAAGDHLAACGYPDVRVIHGDGAEGYAGGAPYDRIIATVGVPDIAPSWRSQLTVGGRLVVPLDLRGPQCSVAFLRNGDHLSSLSVTGCGFMRLRGPSAGVEQRYVLDSARTLRLSEPRQLHVDGVRHALRSASIDVHSTAPVTAKELFGGLGLWLAVMEPEIVMITENEDVDEPRLAQGRTTADGASVAPALLDTDGIAVLLACGRRRLLARAFGPSGESLAERLLWQVQDWDAHGRPSSEDMHIDAYPAGAPVAGQVMEKPASRLVITWPGADRTTAGY